MNKQDIEQAIAAATQRMIDEPCGSIKHEITYNRIQKAMKLL